MALPLRTQRGGAPIQLRFKGMISFRQQTQPFRCPGVCLIRPGRRNDAARNLLQALGTPLATTVLLQNLSFRRQFEVLTFGWVCGEGGRKLLPNYLFTTNSPHQRVVPVTAAVPDILPSNCTAVELQTGFMTRGRSNGQRILFGRGSGDDPLW